MITPIAQRQVLQTASAEAVRAAQEGGEHVQREISRRQILDQRRAEDQGSVHQVSSSENLRLEENARESRQRGREQPGQDQSDTSEPESGTTDSPAAPADSHVDFLA